MSSSWIERISSERDLASPSERASALVARRAPICVVGAGTMGVGIAMVAAHAGHRVKLFDLAQPALERALHTLAENYRALVAKGKLSEVLASANLARIERIDTLLGAGDAWLVIEAVSESLVAKREVFGRLESVVDERCVFASNTSSLSITSIAGGLRNPGRLVGMHFFNPVPQMKLVEIISGAQTAASAVQVATELARSWGKVPVQARSTPGFIVNRIARPFYGEALLVLQQRATEPAAIDACLRGAGFRMGPCELMDLIGHDVNLAVTESLFAATSGDRRYLPSLVQRELVEAGFLGRKSGRGFFQYHSEAPVRSAPRPSHPARELELPPAQQVVLHGGGLLVARWAKALAGGARSFRQDRSSAWVGLEADGAQLRLTDGRPAGLVALREGVADVAVIDWSLVEGQDAAAPALAWACAGAASEKWQALAPAWIAAARWSPVRCQDVPGLIVSRSVAMIINEAADTVLHGVCSSEAVDVALRLGVNYPAGPFEWLRDLDACRVVELLEHLGELLDPERYRVSPELRQRAWLCQSRGHARVAPIEPN